MKKFKNNKEWEEEVRQKSEILFNLFAVNEPTQAHHDRLGNTLKFLCEARPQLLISLNGSKICKYCHREFDQPNENKGPTIQSPCKCISFHRNCLMGVCQTQSKDLNNFELENAIKCVECGRKFSITFIEESLGDELLKERKRIEEVKNRKVRCQICNKDYKYDLMYERICGHGFCNGCFINHLEGIIHKNKGNIRHYACFVEKCEYPAIDLTEIKRFVSKPLWNIYDDYLETIFDPKKQNDTVFKCKNPECSSIKVTTLESKDNEYTCSSCDAKKKETEEQQEKKHG